MAANEKLSEGAKEALHKLGEAEVHHAKLCEDIDRSWRAYEGVLEARSRAADYTSKLTPPYVSHIVETTVASMLDEKLSFRIRPRPRLWNPGELETASVAARGLEILLRWQLDADRFDEKQRPFVLQERIAGVSVAKVYWKTSDRLRKSWEYPQDEFGFVAPRITEELDVVYDGPCFDVIDVKDFVWDFDAPTLERSDIAAHRLMLSKSEFEIAGETYGWRNVKELLEAITTNPEERDRYKRNRERIEVWEIWCRKGRDIYQYYIANRSHLLKEQKNPFWHGQFPFVTFSAHSKPFSVIGQSQVRKLEALQEMLWSITNQRIDNLTLINNAIVLLTDDMDDPESFEYAPMARNIVQDPTKVQLWTPSPVPAQVSIPAEEMLKRDMQNLAGGFPFTSTSEASNVGANTATEASLVTNLAQRSVVSAKTHLYQAYRRFGQLAIELNQQFFQDTVYIEVVGIDDAREQAEIAPEMLKGAFMFDIDPMNESLMRNERRAEAQTLFQVAMQALPLQVQLAAAGVATPISPDPFWMDLLEAFDKKDPARYFKAPMPQQPPTPPSPDAMGTPPGAQGVQETPMDESGVTNPNLAAGPLAPSNANSMAPALMNQQALAMQGGGRSA